MFKERKPFVLSEDIEVLLKQWAEKSGFSLPSGEFFDQLRKEMKDRLTVIFGEGNVDMVSAGELRRGMIKCLQEVIESSVGVISMDRVYLRTNPAIQVTRVMDEELKKCRTGARFGCLCLEKQIDLIKGRYEKVILIDDVLFSGQVMTDVISLLKEAGIEVTATISGIAIGEGIREVKKMGTDVFWARRYREVIDEICERDFYPGVPLSGRSLNEGDVERGVPYLLPFGKPREWASIPKEKEKDFSIFCLKQTAKLWREIEEVTGRKVRCCNLERLPSIFPCDKDYFLDYLEKLL